MNTLYHSKLEQAKGLCYPNGMPDMLPEKEFRTHLNQLFKKIEDAFESVDPDIIEVEQSQGSLVLIFANGTKCILSVQPSVRQLWLAAASKGVAHHFNYDLKTGSWRDDKGAGVEVLLFLKTLVEEVSGLRIHF